MDYYSYNCGAFTQTGRPCNNSGARLVLSIPLCSKHEKRLHTDLGRAIAHGDEYGKHSDEKMIGDVIFFALRDEVELAYLHPWYHVGHKDGFRAGHAAAYKRNMAEKRRVRSTSTNVYFIERGGYIKIGQAVNVVARMKLLEKGGVIMPPGVYPGPLQLLGSRECAPEEEFRVHKMFAKHRVIGEWFTDCQPIRHYISQVCA